MKLIICILRDSDNEAVSQSLIDAGFRVTRVASTGGFLRRGSSTLMIGTEDERVEHAFELVRGALGPAGESGSARATLFVINIERSYQI